MSIQLRDDALYLASRDTYDALRSARQITDARPAAQSFGWIARYAPPERVLEIAEEGFVRISSRHGDAFGPVAGGAWLVRALIERGIEPRRSRVYGLLDHSRLIDHAASRSEALFLLFQGLLPGARGPWMRCLSKLRDASLPASHWRQQRNVCDAAVMVAPRDSRLAHEVLAQVGEVRRVRQARRWISSGLHQDPRPFFWER